MAYCEELGFDGVVFNEHHYSAYGTMPSPNLIAAALSQPTMHQNRRPGQHPAPAPASRACGGRIRHDRCLSGGRLIAGFVRGVPAEYLWYNVNPAESRGRFEEAYELIMTAWTQPVWSHEGTFFQFRDCAIWPRPVQQPHPPIWIAARSAESIEWCVKHHLPTAQIYQTTAQIEDTFGYYRHFAQQAGWKPPPGVHSVPSHLHRRVRHESARNCRASAPLFFHAV